ncbi:hypothetical protein Aab01nite_09920 [Paractinoplanes abujensis]|uniref:Uncharacterized protein n=1 Tax=Paractinoplanes abujensis TaxID=882441 RepID=A0A7W7G212_9ACTN|nr:hypothetical protein [Actinoplanes abujensis]MBB4691181.1 hypothetical protein [Actinoplanes abujensis]GID17402.1 hypothetical protein Aab01nite_09920 [Actinoplanes abujensis]
MTTTDVTSRASAPTRGPGPIAVVQLYVVAAYVAAAVVPYLWAPRADPPTWLWIVPGWLLGVPGFFITLLGAPFMIALVALSVVPLVLRRGASRWSLAATVLTCAVAAFMLTPLGGTIALFVAD